MPNPLFQTDKTSTQSGVFISARLAVSATEIPDIPVPQSRPY